MKVNKRIKDKTKYKTKFELRPPNSFQLINESKWKDVTNSERTEGRRKQLVRYHPKKKPHSNNYFFYSYFIRKLYYLPTIHNGPLESFLKRLKLMRGYTDHNLYWIRGAWRRLAHYVPILFLNSHWRVSGAGGPSFGGFDAALNSRHAVALAALSFPRSGTGRAL